jgi:hypothetical protein
MQLTGSLDHCDHSEKRNANDSVVALQPRSVLSPLSLLHGHVFGRFRFRRQMMDDDG